MSRDERVALSALMFCSPGQVEVVCGDLRPDDFTGDLHVFTFTAIKALTDSGRSPELSAVVDELSRLGRLERVGGAVAVTALLDEGGNVDDLPGHIASVRKASVRRRMVELAQAAESPAADLTSLFRDMDRLRARLDGVTAKPIPRTLTIVEARERAQQGSRFLVGGLIPLGGVTFLTGQPGAGKSALAGELAATLATPGRDSFLGLEIPEEHRGCKVLFMELEDDMAEFLDRLDTTVVTQGLAPGDRLRFQSAEAEGLRIHEPGFEAFVVSADPKLLVVDMVAHASAAPSEDSAADARRFVMNPLIKIARRVGCAILVTHHPVKNGGGRSVKPRGSGAYEGGAAAILSLSGDAKTAATEPRILTVEKLKGRKLVDEIKLGVDLDAGTFRVVGTKLHGRNLAPGRGKPEPAPELAPEPALMPDPLEVLRSQINEVLRKYGPLSREAIRGKVKRSKELVRQALTLEHFDRHKKGKAFIWNLKGSRPQLAPACSESPFQSQQIAS